MKVAFLGNFRPPHSSENDYLWTMRERLGLEVVPLQETEATGEQVIGAALKSDCFFWVHTHGWNTPGRPMGLVLAALRSARVPSFAYHLDLYMGLRRWKDYERHPYMQVDHFFTVDKLMADWLNDNTATKGHFVRAGVIERDCYLLDRPKTHDVVFVGSKNYHAEWPYRRELVDWLQKTYGARFEHWGPQGKGLVRGADLNELYASTKVVVGDTLCPGFDYPHYTSDRPYETLGRGGFLIHPFVEGMEELQDGKHLVKYAYNDWQGLRADIDYYLEGEADRETIRRLGHDKVKADCTYTNRLQQIFHTLEACRG